MPREERRGQAWAHAARSEGESADKVPRPAAAEGDRARAAGGTTQDKEPGKGTGTGGARRGASRAPRRAATERMELGKAPSASVGAAKGMDTSTGRIRAQAGQTRAQVTGGKTRGADRGTKARRRGRDPRAKATAPWALGDRRDGAWEPWGGGAERRERDGGRDAPTAGRAAGAVHPPRHPTNAGAPHPQPPPPPPRPPLQHPPRRRRPHPPPTPPTPAPAGPPPRQGRSRRGWPLTRRQGGGTRRRRSGRRGRRGGR